MSGSKKYFSMREIAADSKTDKNKVYRFIKKHKIKEHSKTGQTLLYDKQQYMRILEGLKSESVPNPSEHRAGDEIDLLKAEIEQKNKQIDSLHRLLENQQKLNLSNQRLLEAQNVSDPKDDQQMEDAKEAPLEKHKGLLSKLFRL